MKRITHHYLRHGAAEDVVQWLRGYASQVSLSIEPKWEDELVTYAEVVVPPNTEGNDI
jgi:hypothetical protein